MFFTLSEFLAPARFWLQAVHLICVMFWLASLYYLPRLFVYHAEAKEEGQKTLLALMETRLMRFIANPAGLLALVSGLALGLAVNWGVLLTEFYWFYGKLIALVVLFGFHGACARWRRELLLGTAPSGRFFRLVNEIPPLLTILIVVLAVVKPF